MFDHTLAKLFPGSLSTSSMSLRRNSFQLHLPKPRSDLLKFSF